MGWREDFERQGRQEIAKAQTPASPFARIFPVKGGNPDAVPRDGGNKNSREHLGPRGSNGKHAGWDIPGAEGDEILGVGKGRVIRAGQGQGYGNVTDIEYDDGTIHRIGHQQRFSDGVKEGGEVAPGQTIGYVGHTGNATPDFPHAHYEVFPNKDAYQKASRLFSRASADLRTNPRDYFNERKPVDASGFANLKPVGTDNTVVATSGQIVPGQPGNYDVASRISPQDYFGPGVKADQLPLGMRTSNNPGNIKFSGSDWQKKNLVGLEGPSTARDQGDPQAQFANPLAGMAGVAKLASTKFGTHGLDTPNKIIADRSQGWTPGNTEAAANIARSMGIGPDDRMDLNDPATMKKFMRGLITQEHGTSGKLYDDDLISRGYDVANGKATTNVASVVPTVPTLPGGGAGPSSPGSPALAERKPDAQGSTIAGLIPSASAPEVNSNSTQPGSMPGSTPPPELASKSPPATPGTIAQAPFLSDSTPNEVKATTPIQLASSEASPAATILAQAGPVSPFAPIADFGKELGKGLTGGANAMTGGGKSEPMGDPNSLAAQIKAGQQITEAGKKGLQALLTPFIATRKRSYG